MTLHPWYRDDTASMIQRWHCIHDTDITLYRWYRDDTASMIQILHYRWYRDDTVSMIQILHCIHDTDITLYPWYRYYTVSMIPVLWWKQNSYAALSIKRKPSLVFKLQSKVTLVITIYTYIFNWEIFHIFLYSFFLHFSQFFFHYSHNFYRLF